MSKFSWLISCVKPIVGRFPGIVKLYRILRDHIASMKKPVMTPWGFKLSGNTLMAEGLFEPEETEIVRKILDDVDVLINIGANIGYYCCHALSMNKSVIAFEPMQQNLSYLCQNIKINNFNGIEIYPVALSNNVGVLDIYGGGTGASILKGWAGAPEDYVTSVPSNTLDNVLGDKLPGDKLSGEKVFILVDIEGAEKWMLEGAEGMLAREKKPVWMVEITTYENQPESGGINPHLKETFQLFFRHGYKAYSADKDMQQITMEDVDLVAKGKLKFNTYNFIFCESNCFDFKVT